MVQRRQMLALLAGGAALSSAGCSRWERLRYRMTVEVETPGGVRVGHAVREIRMRKAEDTFGLGQDRGSIKVRGEAVAVDLSGGQTLFALLSGGDGAPDYASSDIHSLFRQLARDNIQLWPDPPMVNRPIVANPLPRLVRFRDPRDPMTVERVDPTNLAGSFGEGVRLRRITISTTDEAVTTGIERRLGSGYWKNWARIHQEEMGKDGGIMENPYFQTLAGKLTRDDFVRGQE